MDSRPYKIRNLVSHSKFGSQIVIITSEERSLVLLVLSLLDETESNGGGTNKSGTSAVVRSIAVALLLGHTLAGKVNIAARAILSRIARGQIVGIATTLSIIIAFRRRIVSVSWLIIRRRASRIVGVVMERFGREVVFPSTHEVHIRHRLCITSIDNGVNCIEGILDLGGKFIQGMLDHFSLSLGLLVHSIGDLVGPVPD